MEKLEIMGFERPNPHGKLTMIDEFFYCGGERQKLPEHFHQKVVELENLIHIHDQYQERLIEELASLYKVTLHFIFEL